jgi:hypothetical protein
MKQFQDNFNFVVLEDSAGIANVFTADDFDELGNILDVDGYGYDWSIFDEDVMMATDDHEKAFDLCDAICDGWVKDWIIENEDECEGEVVDWDSLETL